MAEIPSDIPSSAAQAGFQSRAVARDRDAKGTGQAIAADRHAKAVTETDTTVDTTDNDNQVYSDAEGTGSQGRPFEEKEDAQKDETADQGSGDGITRDDQGNLHLDLEA